MGDEADTRTGAEQGIALEPDALTPEALRGLIEEFVTRSGTDYGARECSMDEKVDDVLRQILRDEVRIVVDLETGTANIIPADETPGG